LRGAKNTKCENYEFEFHRCPLLPSGKPQNAAAAINPAAPPDSIL
jgi:hypothetical protein